MNKEIEEIRNRIISLLKKQFPSTNRAGFNWSEVEREYGKLDLCFKKTTLRRYLNFIGENDSNVKHSIRYDSEKKLLEIESLLTTENPFNEAKEIKINSSNTSNLQGYYLMVSPSSTDGMLNLFPLKILPSGDFELNYVYKGDVIRGITSFSGNHLSLYSNRKFNRLSNQYVPFFIHSVFNVNASNARIDLSTISFGLSTRRRRFNGDLKAVVEILIKVDAKVYNSLENQAYTLEFVEESSGKTPSFFLLAYEEGSMVYIDNTKKMEILSQTIILSSVPNKGEIKIKDTDLNTILREFYPKLTDTKLILPKYTVPEIFN